MTGRFALETKTQYLSQYTWVTLQYAIHVFIFCKPLEALHKCWDWATKSKVTLFYTIFGSLITSIYDVKTNWVEEKY